jgi:hypothetical protein
MRKFHCPHETTNPLDPAAYTNFGTEPMPVDDQGRIFWHIHNFSTDLELHHQIGLFSESFNAWERYLYPWTFVSTRYPEKAVWHIHTVDENDMTIRAGEPVKSPYSFQQNPDAIAVQYAVIPGFEWSLSMLVNDRYMFDLVHGPDKVEFFKVIVHEHGHGCGLGHTQNTNKNDIMRPVYDPNGEITEDSINGLWNYHGEHIRKTIYSLPHSKRMLQEIGDKPVNGLEHNPGCFPWVFKL